MTDRYQTFTRTPLGQTLVKNLGLPDPTPLQRWVEGSPVIDGPVVFGAISETDAGKAIQALLRDIGASFSTATEGIASSEIRPKALVFDATGARSTAELTSLQRFFSPVIRQLAPAGRVIVVGRTPELAPTTGQHIAQRALEGFTRSLGKEVKRGATVNLVYVAPDAHEQLDSTLRFFLSPKSAYVDGQVARIGTGPLVSNDPNRPLADRVALVTGAARGIGEAIANTLARDGATVIGLDVPQNADALRKVMSPIGGSELLLDVTAVDAPQRIAAHAQEQYGGLDIVVHNAGITRDRRLANMRTDAWDAVLDVNLRAPERITAHLVESGTIRHGGSIIGVSSMSAIAGNNGQTNYATSKAGVIGLVHALAPTLAERHIRINAVAPGFIETEMTVKMPFTLREVGRRINSLQQGGLPIDVAETIAWLADPASAGLTGNIVRVCGQNILGA
jgi:3-oxoacyl-[acyl-carrier protein] reductase